MYQSSFEGLKRAFRKGATLKNTTRQGKENNPKCKKSGFTFYIFLAVCIITEFLWGLGGFPRVPGL